LEVESDLLPPFAIMYDTRFRWIFRSLELDIEDFGTWFRLALPNLQQMKFYASIASRQIGITEWRERFAREPLAWVPPRLLEIVFPRGGYQIHFDIRAIDKSVHPQSTPMWESDLQERVCHNDFLIPLAKYF
jgi:hypothetical protein